MKGSSQTVSSWWMWAQLQMLCLADISAAVAGCGSDFDCLCILIVSE